MAGEELVGPLSAGWEYTTLGEVCARGGGGVQTGPFGSQLHAADYVASGVPSIMPQNIGDNRVVRDGIARITAEDARRLSRYLVRPGDIVYSRRGDVERRALIRDAEDGWLCGTGCLRVRFGDGYIDPTFASYYLGDARVREWVVRHAHGATMPNLNTGILSALPFVEPPLPEQRAIAHILGTLDDKIELNRRMSETLEAMARALFKSWFVDFDPVRAKAEGRAPGLPNPLADLFPDSFEDSELGKIPKGWRVCSIFDVCESIFSGGTPSTMSQQYWGGSIPWLSSGETRSKFIIGTEKTITPEGVSNSSTRLARAGATVIASAGQGHTRGQTSMLMLDSYINQSVVALCADSRHVSDAHLFFDLERRYEQFRQVSDGQSSRGSLTTRLLFGLKTTVSPRTVVQAFDRISAPIVRRIAESLEESRTLSALRDALLPKLISGELRVDDAIRLSSVVA